MIDKPQAKFLAVYDFYEFTRYIEQQGREGFDERLKEALGGELNNNSYARLYSDQKINTYGEYDKRIPVAREFAEDMEVVRREFPFPDGHPYKQYFLIHISW